MNASGPPRLRSRLIGACGVSEVWTLAWLCQPVNGDVGVGEATNEEASVGETGRCRDGHGSGAVLEVVDQGSLVVVAEDDSVTERFWLERFWKPECQLAHPRLGVHEVDDGLSRRGQRHPENSVIEGEIVGEPGQVVEEDVGLSCPVAFDPMA